MYHQISLHIQRQKPGVATIKADAIIKRIRQMTPNLRYSSNSIDYRTAIRHSTIPLMDFNNSAGNQVLTEHTETTTYKAE